MDNKAAERIILSNKLGELRTGIPDLKAAGVKHVDDQAFRQWFNSVKKSLAQDPEKTQQEYEAVESLLFYDLRMRRGDEGYDARDQKILIRDLEECDIQLSSAIENLLTGLKSLPAEAPRAEPKPHTTIHAERAYVHSGQGDQINIETINVQMVLEALAREAEKLVDETEAKNGIRAQITDLAKHPAVTPLLTLGLKGLLGL